MIVMVLASIVAMTRLQIIIMLEISLEMVSCYFWLRLLDRSSDLVADAVVRWGHEDQLEACYCSALAATHARARYSPCTRTA